MTILTQKQARKFKRPMTIDLKKQNAEEYIFSTYSIFGKIAYKIRPLTRFISLVGIILYIYIVLTGGVKFIDHTNAMDTDSINRENARLSRIIQCNYKIDLVKDYIHTNQDIGTRCATIRTLSKDYSPIASIMENINTVSKSPEYWEIYYDIKRIRIKNGIGVNTTGSNTATAPIEISYDMIKNDTGVNIPYALFEGLRNECSVQNAKNKWHCIKTGLSIAYAESSWKDTVTPFGLQSKEKGYKKWVRSYNKYWYPATNGFYFYGDWGVYGPSHYCTDEESSGSNYGCPNGRKNFDSTYNKLSIR